MSIYNIMFLHNRVFLYFIFVISLVYFLYLGSIEDVDSLSAFVLVGVLTAFFNKNMIVVLSTAVIITIILQLSGYNHILFDIKKEGLANKSHDDEVDDATDDDSDDGSVDGDADNIKAKKSKKSKESKDAKKDESPIFEGKEETVYTSVKDASITDQEKMILAHENLLKKMNKYKPLLDTLSGLTKNIVAVKQITQTEKKQSDDNTLEMKKELDDVKTKSGK